MPTPKYNVGIALKKEDWLRLKKLQKQGVKVVNVFRAGLDVVDPQGKITSENQTKQEG